MDINTIVNKLEDKSIDYRERIWFWVEKIIEVYDQTKDSSDAVEKNLSKELAKEFIKSLKLSDQEYQYFVSFAAQCLFDHGADQPGGVLIENLILLPKHKISPLIRDQMRDLMQAQQEAFGAMRSHQTDEVKDRSFVADKVEVYFATNRKGDQGNLENPYRRFRSGEQSQSVTYGKAQISVPKDRQEGCVERAKKNAEEGAKSIYEAIPRSQFYVFEELLELQNYDFSSQVSQDCQEKTLLIFVHGFNQSFHSAVINTAQIKADLNLDGAAVTLAWPAKSMGHYTEAAKSLTQDMIKMFKPIVETILQDSKAKKICLVGHSLGCRMLLRLLGFIDFEGQEYQVQHLVLASADVPVDEFVASTNQLSEHIKHITTYASSADIALRLAIVAPFLKRRAGRAVREIACEHLECIDTENCGGLASTRYRHSDFCETLLPDLRQLLLDDTLAANRQMLIEEQIDKTRRYWVAQLV